ncbi:unnamed protein product [Anisakis simplex]|uniref:Ca2+/calmodulin-dependent protein kinase kinase (inferred by orthology to a C. elegans protein) n=1 Tax=Anisakis simplex TaxID=6269 RepID=A0A0M3J2W8_ANISI|nr:unnamed protein product [Anisakis simplex]
MLPEIKVHDWVTKFGQYPMPSETENCHLVTVTEEEIENCVQVVPRLDTLILVKAMGHRKRFGNPFRTKNKDVRMRKAVSVREKSYAPSMDRHDDSDENIKDATKRYEPSQDNSVEQIESGVEALSLCARVYEESSRATSRSISQAATARQ